MSAAVAHPLSFYLKIGAVCFGLGASMEMFMIKTGFYDKVVELEAQRIEETREDRELFLRNLAIELEKQAEKKNVKLAIPKPPPSS